MRLHFAKCELWLWCSTCSHDHSDIITVIAHVLRLTMTSKHIFKGLKLCLVFKSILVKMCWLILLRTWSGLFLSSSSGLDKGDYIRGNPNFQSSILTISPSFFSGRTQTWSTHSFCTAITFSLESDFFHWNSYTCTNPIVDTGISV